MKKSFILLALAIGGVCFTAQAQNNDDVVPNKNFINQHLKAEKGDVTTEFGLAGGLNNADFKLNEGGSGLLRGRYFVKNDLALRLGFSLGLSHDKKNVYGGTNGSMVGTDQNNNTNFLLNLGIEKHFAGTANLSPYVGGDLLFGISGKKENLDNTDGNVYLADFSSEVKGPGTLSFGIRGVVGADYYIAKHVYLGAEAGLGFLYGHDGKTTISTTIAGHSTSNTIKSTGDTYELNPSIITGIRIGFVF